MELVMGIFSLMVGAVLILNGIFLWFPPQPTDGNALDSFGRKLVIRGIGVFGILSVVFAFKMFRLF